MKKQLLITISLLIIHTICLGQEKNDAKKTKLVVGIVVDQMRFDQLYKYSDRYSENGFKRLIHEGYNFKNMHYNYIPTVTAAGHASIYTGASPSIHGIVGNSWYNRSIGDEIDNVTDSTYTIVGSGKVNLKGISPKNLMSNTISDQIRMHNNFKSKVISISLKDRGAALPGGHTANGAYWYDWQTSPGNFVTSTYYMHELPDWLSNFNEANKPNKYLNKVWNPLYPISSYLMSAKDNNPHERNLRGKDSPTFPYDFKKLREIYKKRNAEYQLMWVTPDGNSILTELALQAIKNEHLGKDNFTDLINIGYSVPDIAGHMFGPQSIEIEDIYLRLDKEIETLLNFLDTNVGKSEYLLFLTSDHAAIPVASYLKKHRLPTGIARIKRYKESLNDYLKEKYNHELISHFDGEQVYLNRKKIKSLGLSLRIIQQEVVEYLVNLEGVKTAISAHMLSNNQFNGEKEFLQKGFYYKRSGDVLLIFDPGYIQSSNSEIAVKDVKGTTHGSGYAYDTHVPMLWYGNNIPVGESVRKVSITDIASTISLKLNIQLPNGNEGKPLFELF